MIVNGSVAGMLQIEGEGADIKVTQILSSGTQIANILINEGKEDEQNIDIYAPTPFSGSWNDLTDKPDLFSGAYADLTGKPTLNGNVITGNMFTDNYSENEERVGTWRDGKPLYKKRIVFTVVGNNSYQRYLHRLEDIDTIFIDQSESFVYFGGASYPLIGYCANPQSSQMAALVWNDGFDYRAGSECNGATCYAAVKYTKTTDNIE